MFKEKREIVSASGRQVESVSAKLFAMLLDEETIGSYEICRDVLDLIFGRFKSRDQILPYAIRGSGVFITSVIFQPNIKEYAAEYWGSSGEDVGRFGERI